ncbi:MAG: CIC family chloride channel protein [Candidatus Azotimanducaceae bacterium]|jgi:CIC family chloride channel protein
MPQFALLGVVSGLVTGLVMVAFRTMIEFPLSGVMAGDPENFEALDVSLLILLPVGGSLVLAALFALLAPESRRVGIVHVLERLARHQGYLPWRNALTQFIGGIIALASGFSGGREGPALHLGAAGSSLLGQALQLPNNSIRILVGCGAAAAISASFNTPLAGVIFSMEVILMEYTVAGFIPVILAAVTATLINQAVFGSSAAFVMPADMAMSSMRDIPFLILQGVTIGIIAALFVRLTQTLHRIAPRQLWARFVCAGIITALLGVLSPEILGVGYDTVNAALHGEVFITVLILVCTLKIIATATTVAMGVPVGVIGPTLFIGATAGGVLAHIGASAYPDVASSAGFYAVIGMGAMMGAVLQAPLAALLAVIELTQNTAIVLPAMMVIIIANLTASQVFGIKSIFITQMEYLGLEYRQNPLSMHLNRASVAAIMSRSFERVPAELDVETVRTVISQKPTWLLVDVAERSPGFILPTVDVIAYLENNKLEAVNLKEIPATRKEVSAVMLQATLKEALDIMNGSGHESLYVNRISAPMIDSVVGIVTRQDIETYYQA